MELKKTVVFELQDLHNAIVYLAKKQGATVRTLSDSELSMIIQNGSLEIEAIAIKGVPSEETELIPAELIEDLCQNIHFLEVFINNVNYDVLREYLKPMINDLDPEEVKFLTEYYVARASKIPSPGPKAIYGESWKVQRKKLGIIHSNLGRRLLKTLQEELRKGSAELVGNKGFRADSEIIHVRELGFSARTWSGILFATGKYIDGGNFGRLGIFLRKEMLRTSPGNQHFNFARNCSIKNEMEIEDFMLLYNLY